MACYLRAIESGYQANPYHSAVHAAGVVHMVHMLLTNGLIQSGALEAPMQLACYLAGKHSIPLAAVRMSTALARLSSQRSSYGLHVLRAVFMAVALAVWSADVPSDRHPPPPSARILSPPHSLMSQPASSRYPALHTYLVFQYRI